MPIQNPLNNLAFSELDGYRNLIENARTSYILVKKDPAEMDESIDAYCRKYLDIIIPKFADRTDILGKFRRERPSMETYIIQKMNEFLSLKPSPYQIKIELKGLYNTYKEKYDEKIFKFMTVYEIIHRYGFSSDVFFAVKEFDVEMTGDFLFLYYNKLRQAQTIDDINLAYVKSRLGFLPRLVLDKDLEMLAAISREFGLPPKDFHAARWAVTPSNTHFLIALQGEYYGARDNWVFAFVCGDYHIKIEASYSQKSSCDGLAVYWQINEVLIPTSLRYLKEILLEDIIDALKVYSVEKYAYTAEVSVNCELTFTDLF